MKFFKKKNLLNVLYAVLIALPLFSILGRVLYTQWNQNAKDSYSGSSQTIINYKYQTNEVNNLNDVISGNLYYLDEFEYDEQRFVASGAQEIVFRVILLDSIDIDIYSYYMDDMYISSINNNYYVEFYFTDNIDSTMVMVQIGETYTSLGIELTGTSLKLSNLYFIPIFFDLLYKQSFDLYMMESGYLPQESDYNEIASVDITTDTLDNAFDYSISQFVSENDFGKLNFFTWFSDLFLSNNSVNNLYIHFVNWYLNYTLYVSLGYILWLVLMWFVSFIRRLLEKTSTYETGGF